MTREEAKREMMFAKRNVIADSWIDQAYDVTIEALSQPEREKGEWILQSDDHHEYYECDQCGICVGLFDVRNFCCNCGADMRGKQNG